MKTQHSHAERDDADTQAKTEIEKTPKSEESKPADQPADLEEKLGLQTEPRHHKPPNSGLGEPQPGRKWDLTVRGRSVDLRATMRSSSVEGGSQRLRPRCDSCPPTRNQRSTRACQGGE